MIQRALPAVIIFLGLSLALAAQSAKRAGDQTIMQRQLGNASALETGSRLYLDQPGVFTSVDCSILIHDLPLLGLLDGSRLPISNALGRMGSTPFDIAPVAFLTPIPARRTLPAQYDEGDAPEGALDSRLSRVYTSGEIGFSYGKSIGRHGGDAKSGYVIGTVGTDKFQVTAGASYEESNGRYFRRGRYPLFAR